MASDRFDDEYDDRPRRRPGGDRAAAKGKVLGPAIGLIVIGAFLVFGAGINVASGLTGQIGRLEERIAVLERIATDPAGRTAREIDALR